MLPDAVMIADDTSGPMNADVLPTTEKSAKNRNLRGGHVSPGRVEGERRDGTGDGGRGTHICGRGETSLIIVWL